LALDYTMMKKITILLLFLVFLNGCEEEDLSLANQINGNYSGGYNKVSCWLNPETGEMEKLFPGGGTVDLMVKKVNDQSINLQFQWSDWPIFEALLEGDSIEGLLQFQLIEQKGFNGYDYSGNGYYVFSDNELIISIQQSTSTSSGNYTFSCKKL